jgi:hypothetical protein
MVFLPSFSIVLSEGAGKGIIAIVHMDYWEKLEAGRYRPAHAVDEKDAIQP